MNKKKRKLAVISALVLVFAIGASLTAYYYLNQSPSESMQETPPPPASQPETGTSDEVVQPAGILYESGELGISFYYPEEWLKLECDNSSNAYFAVNETGLGIVEGVSILCGLGTDFAPQSSIRERASGDIADPSSSSEYEKIHIDGREGYYESVYYEPDEFVLYPGSESTRYVFYTPNDSLLEISYTRWPNGTDDDRDNSIESRDAFKRAIEDTLRFKW